MKIKKIESDTLESSIYHYFYKGIDDAFWFLYPNRKLKLSPFRSFLEPIEFKSTISTIGFQDFVHTLKYYHSPCHMFSSHNSLIN